ncbi:CG0192-related protein [Rhodococcoides yunnanense]|uniref:CG0192-related protein n=1 Tax=Rhodococcoides yunnanense TaxID=278209 RepID=UPI000933F871|nr:hypothetical protein [Rhodococcus yunnanensis]
MALLHRATLSPSKLDMMRSWLPNQSWIENLDTSGVEILGAYRFDDPAGAVGIETHLLLVGTRVVHAPVTYRDAPLEGAERHLVTTMEHSVLGRRWVYDAVADPVYIEALARTILTGGVEATLEYDQPVSAEKRKVTTRVTGSGHPDAHVPTLEPGTISVLGTTTTIEAGSMHLDVLRVIDPNPTETTHPFLSGTWPGRIAPAVLAVAHLT